MMRIEPSKHALNLLSFLIGPGSVRIFARGLHHGPPAQGGGAQDFASAAAELTHDPAASRIDLGSAAHWKQLAAADALVQHRSESEKGEKTYLEAERGLDAGLRKVQGFQKGQRGFEDFGCGLVIGKTLPNRRQPCSRGGHRVEIPKDVQVGTLDGHALKVSELAPALSQLCSHEHVGL